MILGIGKLAIRNTLRRGKKSWITIIAVVIGISAVVSLVSIGEGLEGAIAQEFEGLGANNVYVSGEIDEGDLETVKRARGVEEAGMFLQSTEEVVFSGERNFVNVYGVQLEEIETIFSGQGWSIESGTQFRDTDRRSALVGSSFQDNFENDIRRRSQIRLNDSTFKVKGFYSAGEPSAQNAILVPLEEMRDVYSFEDDEVSRFTVSIQEGFTQEQVQENIEEELRREKNVDEDEQQFSTSTPQDILDSLRNVLSIVQSIVVGLASIALIVGAIGIMNTMYMAINERTQEIGVLKAIGASKRSIRVLFLMEAGLIGFTGGLIGVLIGIGITEATVFLATEFGSVDIIRGYTLNLLLSSITFSTLIGVISGYLPARKASNLDPADALRYE